MQNVQTLGAGNIQKWLPFILRVDDCFGNDRGSSATCKNVKLKSIAIHTLKNRPKKKHIQPAAHQIFRHRGTQAKEELDFH